MSDSDFHVTLQPMSVRQVFANPLKIPDYQRSYSWRSSHVLDLLKDTTNRTSKYQLGTVILHQNEHYLEIVDGQQRLVTLTIALAELGADDSSLPLLDGKFSKDSAGRISSARTIIRNFLSGKDETAKSKYLEFLCDNLVLAVLTLKGENALDRAYTFFDSVNSKGKSLTDFDLLKAHHLMFIPTKQEALAASHNDDWQGKDDRHDKVFSAMLRRLRMWGRRKARDSRADRPDFGEFSSVIEPHCGDEGEYLLNRYMQPSAFRSWRRVGQQIVLSMDYPAPDAEALVPVEVTQSIEGGDPFFIYSRRYHGLYESLFSVSSGKASTAVAFVRALAVRITNEYLRDAFCAIMLLYVDKFSEDRAIEVAVCVERIISQRRWDAVSLRIEGTLTHVCKMDVVPILLDAVNSLHVYSQLVAIAERLEGTNVRELKKGVSRRYYDSLKGFYLLEQWKITDTRVRSLTGFYLQEERG